MPLILGVSLTQPIKVAKEEEPPYGGSKELKLLNAIKVCHILVDDPNIALYVQEIEELLNCYCDKNLAPSTIKMEKVLYVYLKGLSSMKLTPIFIDKFGITYEPMEQRVAQGTT